MGCTDDKIRHDAGAYTGTGSRFHYKRIWRIGPDVEGLLQMPCGYPTVDGRPASQANKAESQATYNVTIRWQNNVSLPLRIVWLNNKCRIMYVSAAVADDAKRTNIVLTAEERDDSE